MQRTHMIFSFTCLFAIAMVLQGCISRWGDFTALSGKNIDIQGGLHAASERQRVTGVAWKIFGTPDLEEAVDNATEKFGGGVGLTNVVVERYTFPFYQAFRVTGDPVIEIGGKAEGAGVDIIIK